MFVVDDGSGIFVFVFVNDGIGNFHGIVGSTVIDKNYLNMWVCLLVDGLQTFFYVFFYIVNRDDNAY